MPLVQSFWKILSEMAPYLWAGFLAAFLLRRFFNPSLIRSHLGKESFSSVLLATIAGIPIPLCSCGILPLAATLRREGASRAAVSAFAISTPQTGIDSFLATAGLLGWPLALMRVLAALFSGSLAGFLVALTEKSPAPKSQPPSTPQPQPLDHPPSKSPMEKLPRAPISTTPQAAHFAFVRLPADIGPSLLLGTFLAAALVSIVPPNLIASLPGGKLTLYAAVTVFALPVYVCSTGAIPLAFGLIAAGLPPGAAFLVLAAGPSISIASILTLTRLIGTRALLLALLALLTVTWAFAFALDSFPPLHSLAPHCSPHESSPSSLNQLTALFLLALIALSWLSQKSTPNS